jgi:hypothetical protein
VIDNLGKPSITYDALERELFQQIIDYDDIAGSAILLTRTIVYLCGRYNNEVSQEHIIRSIEEMTLAHTGDADLENKLQTILRQMTALQLTDLERDTSIVRFFEKMLNNTIKSYAQNPPVQERFSELQTKIQLRIADLLFAHRNDATPYTKQRAVRDVCSDYSGASASITWLKSDDKRPPPRIAISAAYPTTISKSSTNHNSSKLHHLSHRRQPHTDMLKAVHAPPIINSCAIDFLEPFYPSDNINPTEMPPPEPEIDHAHWTLTYLAENYTQPPYDEYTNVDSDKFHAIVNQNLAPIVSTLPTSPESQQCVCCGLPYHLYTTCPWMDRKAYNTSGAIQLSHFRLAAQHPDVQQVWINQAIKFGCMKDWAPNMITEFKTLVAEQMSRFEEQRAIRRNEQMNSNYQRQPYGRSDYTRPTNNYPQQSPAPYRPQTINPPH